MADKETLSVYAERAAEYGAKFTSAKPPRHLRKFLDMLPKGAKVLDLGCGHGSTSIFLAEAGHSVDAWDASAEMLALVPDHPRVSASQAEFDELKSQEVYDGIWCNFALLHSPREDMPKHLASIAAALRSNGAFHLGLKTGQGSKRDRLGRFYTYFEVEELRELLDKAGFIISSVEEGEEPGLAGPIEPYVIIKARKSA